LWWTQVSANEVRKAAAYGSVGLFFDNAGSDAANLTYTLDNSLANSLAAGQQVTETFSIPASDGVLVGATDVVFTIEGTNDAPTVSVTSTPATLIEASGNDAGVATATATLLKSDVDGGSLLHYDITLMLTQGWTQVSATEVRKAATYGTVSLFFDNAGSHAASLTYTLDNGLANSAAGQQVTETFSIPASDGVLVGATDVVFTIQGTNDAPTASVTSTPTTLIEASGSNAGVSTATAILLKSDVDGGSILHYDIALMLTQGWTQVSGNEVRKAATYGSVSLFFDSAGKRYSSRSLPTWRPTRLSRASAIALALGRPSRPSLASTCRAGATSRSRRSSGRRCRRSTAARCAAPSEHSSRDRSRGR
jgi:VCBS repeat-containing protein